MSNIVYVSVSGGIAEAMVVEGNALVVLIDWDDFQDTDLTDPWVEENLVSAYHQYQVLPKGSRDRSSVRRDLLELLRRRRDDINYHEATEAEIRKARIAAAHKILAEEGE